MDKYQYLVKTLSRTKRKDDENYVLNAIWNKIDVSGLSIDGKPLTKSDIKPVSQQFIRRPNSKVENKKSYFIDLYFPQINVGIECDEEYHNSDTAHEHDQERHIEIVDILNAVDDTKGTYEELRIHAAQLENESGDAHITRIDDEITACSLKITQRIREAIAAGTFEPWIDQTMSAYDFLAQKNDGMLTVQDNLNLGRTQRDVVSVLWNVHASQKSCYRPRVWDSIKEIHSNARIWFPNLSVDGSAVKNHWVNQLSEDGTHIFQHLDNSDIADFSVANVTSGTSLDSVPPRYVFVKYHDWFTGTEQIKFLGLYKIQPGLEEFTRADGTISHREVFERIDDKIPVTLGDRD